MWELEHNAVRKPLAEWGLAAVSCDEAHASTGTFNLRVLSPDVLAHTLPFAFKDAVTIHRGATPWFRGHVAATARFGEPLAEGIDVMLADAWWWLDNTPYLQPWASRIIPETDPEIPDPGSSSEITVDPQDESIKASLVMLSTDAAGAPISVNAAITAVVTAAVTDGCPIALGALPANDVTIWGTSRRDLACGDVLRELFRWHPDAVAWLDHAADPPTLNLTPRSTATLTTKTVRGEDDVASWKLRSREDLRPEAVCLTYFLDGYYNGEVSRVIIKDVAPSEHSGTGPFVVRASVSLRGPKIDTQAQSIRCTRIPGNSTLDLDSEAARDWFVRHLPQFKNIEHPDLKIAGTPIVDFAPDPEPDAVDPLTKGARALRTVPDVEDLPYELLDGTLDDWSGAKARKIIITAKLGVTEAVFQALATKEEKALFTDWDPTLGDSGLNICVVRVTVLATNQRTRTRHRITSYETAESVPEGIAQHVYNATRELHFEGNVTLSAEETGEIRHLGRALTISDASRPEWNVRMQIQQVSYDLDTGTCSITVGPPPHLGLQELAELARMGRDNPAQARYPRNKSDLKDGTRTSGGYVGPSASSHGPGGGSTIDLPFDGSFGGEVGARTITIGPGYWRDGTEGTLTAINETTGTGEKAYLKIAQQASGALAASSPVTVLITSDEKPAYELNNVESPSAEAPFWVQYSYVPLGHISGSGESATWLQERHGNFMIVAWHLGAGYVGKWVESILGSTPPPPAPPPGP